MPPRCFGAAARPSAMSSPPSVLFCADIFHTQGASIAAFRSYLSTHTQAEKFCPVAYAGRRSGEPEAPVSQHQVPSQFNTPGLVARAVKELAPIPVSAQIPEGSSDSAFGFGFGLDAPFTNESLQQFANTARFSWRRSDAPGSCSFYTCDVRVGDALHVHRGVALQKERHNKSAAAANGLAPFFARHNLTAFVDGIWRYLRTELAALPEWRPSGGELRVSLLLLHLMAGPLAQVGVLLPEESRLVARLIQFAEPPRGCPPETRRHCVHVFVRDPITRPGYTTTDYNVSRTIMPGCRETSGFGATMHCRAQLPLWPDLRCPTGCHARPAAFWPEVSSLPQKPSRNKHPIAEYARDVFGALPESARECVYFNAKVDKYADPKVVLNILREAAPNGTKVYLSAVERRVPRERVTSARHPAVQRGPPFFMQTPTAATLEDFEYNSCARLHALEAPLFVIEAGSHWGDHVLAQRTALGRPSAILRYVTTSGVWFPWDLRLPVAAVDIVQGGLQCATFFKGLCANTVIPPMIADLGLCWSLMYRCYGNYDICMHYRMDQPGPGWFPGRDIPSSGCNERCTECKVPKCPLRLARCRAPGPPKPQAAVAERSPMVATFCGQNPSSPVCRTKANGQSS